ncbi:lysine methyltransferase [Schizosaccharomyces japonicus yFS275]|uniref:Lysine methyltransferase n=1 Tax=Schizosaccharomyces japonicus (strain yFS275 / FY16936) TaxID=402676 RepID=B6JY24_SCHJY|nr:lysine methyltransferase [Schizosaccharomyces japonicus yFS275]EEB06442.1 lysine methyltransferase [Schizosaccharomyces japonicus yFS275]
MTVEAPDSYKNLLAWLEKNRAFIHDDLYIDSSLIRGDGVFARTAIGAQTPLASIPKNIILSVYNSPYRELIATMGERSTKTDTSTIDTDCSSSPFDALALVRLTVALLLEKYNERSFWRPFVDSLLNAETPDLPIYWPPETLEQLEGTCVHSLVVNCSKLTAFQFISVVQPFFETVLVPKGLPCPSWSEYLHAFVLVQTRCFFIDSTHQLALVPFCDILNHRSGTECATLWVPEEKDMHDSWDHFDPDNDTCDIILQRSVNPGDEVFNSYGQYTADELFAHYGFVDVPHALWRIDFYSVLLKFNKRTFRKWLMLPSSARFDCSTFRFDHSLSISEESAVTDSLPALYKSGPNPMLWSYLFYHHITDYQRKQSKANPPASPVDVQKLTEQCWRICHDLSQGKHPCSASVIVSQLVFRCLKTLVTLCNTRKRFYKNGNMSAAEYEKLIVCMDRKNDSRAFFVCTIISQELRVLEENITACERYMKIVSQCLKNTNSD